MVSLVILSYNTAQYLSECISSVYQNSRGIDFEVVVVDNNSTDNSIHTIKTRFPKVKLIESKENLGFAKGVNKGIEHAKGEWVLLLNSDTRVHKNSIAELIEFSEKNSDAVIIGGRLKNKDGSTSSSYSAFYTPLKVFALLFLPKRKERDSREPREVDWVSGGFTLIKKDVFEKIGGFDPQFFMYIEDMELCYRLKKNGYKVFYDPKAAVDHVGQGSSNRSFAIIQIYKGLLYFYKKHKKGQYHLVKFMLYLKAGLSLAIGYLKGDSYLRSTYTEVFRQVL